MGFLDETGLARFLDNIKSRYVKNATYCADCNAALAPGKYYMDANTLNGPELSDSKAGILNVESIGGASDKVFQECITTRTSSAEVLVKYGRVVTVSSGAFSSAWPWCGEHLAAAKWPRWFSIRENKGGAGAVFCPPSGPQLRGQTGSNYEFVRLYHTRDANRDNSYNSYGFLGRFCDTTAPTSGSYNLSSIFIGSQEGGIASPIWTLSGRYRCASNVTYTDSTTEAVYGKYLVAGDEYNGKTVASVTYSREASAAAITFSVANLASVGSASSPMAHVYATTGTVETSDERLKQSIQSIPDDVLDAWGEVGWVQYQLKDAVEKKGADARLHSGAVAQRIDAIFKSHGLDASRYGLFCYDVWEEDETQPAGDRFSLRYEEALAMEAAFQRRRADRLEARIAALEARLNG